jgi:hypothetical protein
MVHAYVPVFYNDGARIPLLTLVDTRVPILERWGGLTILENAQGMATKWPPEIVDVYECVCEVNDVHAEETVMAWWRYWAAIACWLLQQDEVRVALWQANTLAVRLNA